MSDILIIICTEKGEIENQSLLFVRSLRRFGGILANARIVSISPRPNYYPSSKTLQLLESQDVEVVVNNINKRFPDYGFGNKPQACSYVEQNYKAERFLFIDSDQLVINPPIDLLNNEKELAFAPVDRKGVGTTGSDHNVDFWSRAYAQFGIENVRKVRTTINDEEIYEYWNGGLMSVRASTDYFSTWNELLEKMIVDELLPEGKIAMSEQASIAITAQTMNLDIHQFPKGYNYPVHEHSIVTPKNKLKSVDEGFLLHYHRSFKTPFRSENQLISLIESHIERDWFFEQFKELAIYPRPFLYSFDYLIKRYSHSIKSKIGSK